MSYEIEPEVTSTRIIIYGWNAQTSIPEQVGVFAREEQATTRVRRPIKMNSQMRRSHSLNSDDHYDQHAETQTDP